MTHKYIAYTFVSCSFNFLPSFWTYCVTFPFSWSSQVWDCLWISWL